MGARFHAEKLFIPTLKNYQSKMTMRSTTDLRRRPIIAMGDAVRSHRSPRNIPHDEIEFHADPEVALQASGIR